MITFDSVSVQYDGAPTPAIQDVSLSIPEGELALVVGGTGTGKSTLLNCVNGLVPHFTGGTLTGRVTVCGRDTRVNPPRELADVVGVVRQNPQSGFVTDTVEDELAYTMESLAIAPDIMRRRVEETMDILGLADLRFRPLRTLSGGEQQRVAIGSVLTAQPSVLVLDEPTSALDPQAAEDVLASIQRLVHDLGLTVLMSEHRLERVVQYADQIVIVKSASNIVQYLNPAEAMRHSPIRPPIVELGLALDWQPLPLSIRDARRCAVSARESLQIQPATPSSESGHKPQDRHHRSRSANVRQRRNSTPGSLSRATVRFGNKVAVRQMSISFLPNEVAALMGRNGAGKSSALRLLAGSIRPTSGKVAVGNQNPVELQGPDLLSQVAFVPQDPDVLLWAESVAAECAAADQDAHVDSGTCQDLLDQLLPGVDFQTHPRDLSVGSRLMLVLAIMLSGRPNLLILDEPTRGLDYTAKLRLGEVLRARADLGASVVLATHDVEFVASLCDRVVIMADGDVVADDDAARSVLGSAVFAPQVAKIMAPLELLTPADVVGRIQERQSDAKSEGK
jgi:energy-coupling factor transporter ATP-binding protein EcfA2